MLVIDLQAPWKQRHTAHRIWTRLRAEHPDYPVAEATVRRYVQQRKPELGLGGREVFVPRSQRDQAFDSHARARTRSRL